MESFRRSVLKKRLRHLKKEAIHIIEDDSMNLNNIILNYKNTMRNENKILRRRMMNCLGCNPLINHSLRRLRT